MSRQDTIGNHCTTVFTDEMGYTCVVYHQTCVVRWNAERIILNTGGYETVTTKRRMNQAANQFRLGFGVYQQDHTWYVDYKGMTLRFLGDVIELDRVNPKDSIQR